MFTTDLVMLLAIVLTGLWLTPPFGRLLAIGRELRDDFGDVVPHVQARRRQQFGQLLRRLAIVALAVFLLTYALTL